MQLSTESLLVILVVGLIAGWLAGLIVRGNGLGLVGDLVVGVLGAFIGSWLLPQLHIGTGQRHRRGHRQRHDRGGDPFAHHSAGARRGPWQLALAALRPRLTPP